MTQTIVRIKMNVGTFENIKCFPFQIYIDYKNERGDIMTKREKSLYKIILLLILIILIVLSK